MEYIKAQEADYQIVGEVVRKSIEGTYPYYYPTEVVEFFLALHSLENIKEDIIGGNVWLLIDEGRVVGTGAFKDNHITRVYVLPEYQGKGYGSYIMEQLEEEISKHYTKAELDASLPAATLYAHRGYSTKAHGKWQCENGVVLVYEVMEKDLNRLNPNITYNGRTFTTKANSENGEVGEETIFHYYQEDHLFWAEYSGGEIQKGTMIGYVNEDASLDFHYQHINTNNEVRIGKCHSIPRMNALGKLEMLEEWQWLNGDLSNGKSIVVEI